MLMKKRLRALCGGVLLLGVLLASPMYAYTPMVTPVQPVVEPTPEMIAEMEMRIQEMEEQNRMYDAFMNGQLSESAYLAYVRDYCDKTFADPDAVYNAMVEQLDLVAPKARLLYSVKQCLRDEAFVNALYRAAAHDGSVSAS